MVEGEHEINMIPEPQDMAPSYPMSAEKEALFKSPKAMAFEKGTIATYDNQNIERSQLEEVLPDVPSNFPNSEQSIPMKDLTGHEYH